jgi:hypothetical protein
MDSSRILHQIGIEMFQRRDYTWSYTAEDGLKAKDGLKAGMD